MRGRIVVKKRKKILNDVSVTWEERIKYKQH